MLEVIDGFIEVHTDTIITVLMSLCALGGAAIGLIAAIPIIRRRQR